MTRTAFYVSDGTAITAETIGHATLSQYDFTIEHITVPFIESDEKANLLKEQINRRFKTTGHRPFVFHTFVDKSLAEKIAVTCPNACIGIITNPVNTTVAIAAEVLKKAGVYDKNKLFGVTTLDVIRSETFVAELKDKDPGEIRVPVIGGHSGVTILPLLSQVEGVELTAEEVAALTPRIQNAGTEVVEAKAGGGSATLSMGQAACRFGLSLVKALSGEKGVVECAYVEGNGEHARFFAQPILLGKNGVEEIQSYGELSAFEQEALDSMLDTLKADIKIGEEFVK
mgnify:CR=1 FL=1